MTAVPNTAMLAIVITVIVGAYVLGMAAYLRSGKSPYLHAVLVSTCIAASCFYLLGIDKPTVQNHAVLIDLMLGPTIVALAVPLYDNFRAVRTVVLPLVVATVVSGFLIILSTFLLLKFTGFANVDATSISLRSITAPVSVVIAKTSRLQAELTMLSAFFTGLVGVFTVPYLARKLGIQNHAAIGFILGVTAHTFGIAKAVEIGPRTAAFATVGMGFTAAIAAIVIPLVI